jgi:hypothetical protein
MNLIKSLAVVVFGALLATNLSACSKEAKPGDAAKPAKAASTAGAAPAAEPIKPSEPAKVAEPAKAAEKKDAGADRAGKGEMKEVCHDKIGKDGKPVLDKEGKAIRDCKMIRVRQKLEATEIPPAKK